MKIISARDYVSFCCVTITLKQKNAQKLCSVIFNCSLASKSKTIPGKRIPDRIRGV